ncbi:MAG: Glutamate--tRNA ligase [Betaproteobacteria bacterium]|nr:Glutamate--tRNA ligase [Betaproteobacteria bacterium]
MTSVSDSPIFDSSYRGRFAPSPTGPLHFGSLVAAVASYLEAKTHDGEWLVRMEDLDTPRTVAGAADEILRALEACGMHWDGAVVRQSARSDAYHAELHRLRAQGIVYPCACTRREIADSALHGIEGPVYPGTCRDGLAADKLMRAWRIDTRGVVIDFEDAIQGPLEQELATDIGDFVLLRADHVYSYQLAVVVDDAEQGITDVVRGADLLDSTPRQIFLQRRLHLPTPRYCHVPIAVNPAGEKLSKQTRALAIDYSNPLAALMPVLRFLGHQPPSALAKAAVADLWQWAIANWRIDRVPRTRSSPSA